VMRGIGMLFLALALPGSAAAGEFVFTNGSRLAGELANEVLMISTGSDVIEVGPDQVGVLTQDEIRLKDGRVMRGTLVGGHLKARTALGELVIKLDDLRVFRAHAVATQEAAAPVTPPPARAPVAASAPAEGAAPEGPGQVVAGAKRIGHGVEEAAKGVGKTVTEGADRLHDGAKAFGEAIWDVMKSVGRTVQRAFTGPQAQ